MKAGWCGAPRGVTGGCTRWMAASTADAYRFVWLRFPASLVCSHPQDAGDLSLNIFVPFLLWFPARHWSHPYALGIQCCSAVLGQISVNFLLLFLIVCYCYGVLRDGDGSRAVCMSSSSGEKMWQILFLSLFLKAASRDCHKILCANKISVNLGGRLSYPKEPTAKCFQTRISVWIKIYWRGIAPLIAMKLEVHVMCTAWLWIYLGIQQFHICLVGLKLPLLAEPGSRVCVPQVLFFLHQLNLLS